ncbi:hypothetical protein [Thermodesulfobacterium thermophilum]|uniref:hypothetical protein n=1 Tax=Thermodesulfobacterium thermophilum TaxID=886 RepID=UPI0003B7826C|nr:hypothetical protein [Thermodesulfobacterium thermophilum]
MLLCPCAERLHPVLPSTIDILLKEGLLKHYDLEIINETKGLSFGTLKRIIIKFKKPTFRKRYKGQAFIYHQVPISADFGKYAKKVGAVRACGFGKNLESMKLIDKIAHQRIFFPVEQYHQGNDKSILRVLFEKALSDNGIKVFRSRPYKKNDNAHVEQKGGDKVKYKVIDKRGRVIKKIYDQAKTPYQRLMEISVVSEEVKEALRKSYEGLSLVGLKRRLDELLAQLLGGKLKRRDVRGQKNDLTNYNFGDIHF